MEKKKVVVRVPATTANIGPGFDTLGIALSLHNWTTVSLGRGGSEPNEMMRQAVSAFFRAAKRKIVSVSIDIRGDVPIARGLGSSVTVRLGIVAGLNKLFGEPLSSERLLEVVTELEGHPDNAAPALLGGFVASGMIGSEVRTLRVQVPAKLKFVAVIPGLAIETKEARKVLPKQVTLHDAVSNVNRVALIMGAFATRDYEKLRGSFDDTFHQPYRQKLLPPLFDVIRAGEQAGALGGWLSGSGSTILCVTLRDENWVAAAMSAVLARKKIESRSQVLMAANQGVQYAF
ncbi:MAG: homoserine kinase [Verrucomicrobiae bacterium]|nr:homoserine kinase [Verrucomicrobiae bacterium]